MNVWHFIYATAFIVGTVGDNVPTGCMAVGACGLVELLLVVMKHVRGDDGG